MSENRGLSGHLELVCDVDARGHTRLRRQSFRAPVHLSKPFHDEGALVLNLVSPTAGLLEGDRVRVDMTIQPGARVMLTTPAASRVHTMRGGHAEVTQRFRVEAGGSLDWWPELLIPQRSARYAQRTSLDLAAGAELLYFESLAPGRAAAGELFEYAELRWAMDLRIDGRLLGRERYALAPGNGSLTALRRYFPGAYYASALLVSPSLAPDAACWEMLRALQCGEVWSGVSALGEAAFAWKVAAADSLALRRTLQRGRAAVYAALGRRAPALRRAGG